MSIPKPENSGTSCSSESSQKRQKRNKLQEELERETLLEQQKINLLNEKNELKQRLKNLEKVYQSMEHGPQCLDRGSPRSDHVRNGCFEQQCPAHDLGSQPSISSSSPDTPPPTPESNDRQRHDNQHNNCGFNKQRTMSSDTSNSRSGIGIPSFRQPALPQNSQPQTAGLKQDTSMLDISMDTNPPMSSTCYPLDYLEQLPPAGLPGGGQYNSLENLLLVNGQSHMANMAMQSHPQVVAPCVIKSAPAQVEVSPQLLSVEGGNFIQQDGDNHSRSLPVNSGTVGAMSKINPIDGRSIMSSDLTTSNSADHGPVCEMSRSQHFQSVDEKIPDFSKLANSLYNEEAEDDPQSLLPLLLNSTHQDQMFTNVLPAHPTSSVLGDSSGPLDTQEADNSTATVSGTALNPVHDIGHCPTEQQVFQPTTQAPDKNDFRRRRGKFRLEKGRIPGEKSYADHAMPSQQKPGLSPSTKDPTSSTTEGPEELSQAMQSLSLKDKDTHMPDSKTCPDSLSTDRDQKLTSDDSSPAVSAILPNKSYNLFTPGYEPFMLWFLINFIFIFIIFMNDLVRIFNL